MWPPFATTASGANGTDPATAPDEPLAARLQARVDALESQPERTAVDPRPRRSAQATPGTRPPPPGPSPDLHGAVDDLNRQFVLLREQLDAAFDDVESRVAAAHAEARAAQEQVAEMNAAVDQLVDELSWLAAPTADDGLAQLRGALNRFKSRYLSG